MARVLDAKCRQCRREGEKLFLKAEKCFTDKCAIERRAYAPGQHGQKSGARWPQVRSNTSGSTSIAISQRTPSHCPAIRVSSPIIASCVSGLA